jgi:hypothetical protein
MRYRVLAVGWTLIVAAAMVASGQSADSTSQWEPAGTSAKVNVFVNSGRIDVVDGGLVEVWVRTEYNKPQRSGIARGEYTSDLEHVRADCRRMRILSLSVVIYDKHGAVVGRASEAAYAAVSSWESPTPDSIGEKTLQTICRLSKRSP